MGGISFLGLDQTSNLSCVESNHSIRRMKDSTFESIEFDQFDLGRPKY